MKIQMAKNFTVVNFFFHPSDGGARSSAGECAAAAAINLLTPQNIMGLSLVSTAGAVAQSAVNKAAAVSSTFTCNGKRCALTWTSKKKLMHDDDIGSDLLQMQQNMCFSSYSMLWNLSWHSFFRSCLRRHTSCMDC